MNECHPCRISTISEWNLEIENVLFRENKRNRISKFNNENLKIKDIFRRFGKIRLLQ